MVGFFSLSRFLYLLDEFDFGFELLNVYVIDLRVLVGVCCHFSFMKSGIAPYIIPEFYAEIFFIDPVHAWALTLFFI